MASASSATTSSPRSGCGPSRTRRSACSARARASPVAELPTAPSRHRGTFFGAALVVVALDQLTKHWALQALADGPIDVAGSLRWNLAFNDGAAFSLGGGGGNTRLIALVGLGVVAVIVRMGWIAHQRSWALGLGILLGGALGNLVDRALRAGDGFLGGRVVDFIDLQWWPIFNVADAALWVGVGVLVVASLRGDEASG